MWAWQNAGRPGDKVATAECPVSYVTGESLALLEEYYSYQALGAGADIREWPARRADAFLLLRAEQRKLEAGSDA